MTNRERQRSLDRLRRQWTADAGVEASGRLDFCGRCEYRADGGGCLTHQAEREDKALCAKAFNRLNRRRKEKNDNEEQDDEY
jgi:hypothetical protein